MSKRRYRQGDRVEMMTQDGWVLARFARYEGAYCVVRDNAHEHCLTSRWVRWPVS